MNNRTYILINSNINNTIALDLLLKSLNGISIPILVVIGDYNTTIPCKRITKYLFVCYVMHNSIDFTGLNALIDHEQVISNTMNGLPERWFYLHDTCEITDVCLFEKVCINTNETTRLLRCQPSMNMGIYKHSDVIRASNIITKQKSNINPSQEEILKLKRNAIINEDIVFKAIGTSNALSEVMTMKERFRYPGSEVDRIIEVYSKVGFRKYKANYGQGGRPILTI